MGKWLRKLKKAGTKLVGEDAMSQIENKISDQIDSATSQLLTESSSDVVDDLLTLSSSSDSSSSSSSSFNLKETVGTLQSMASECHTQARETMEICETTKQQQQTMIEFTSTIQSSMESLSSSSSSSFEEGDDNQQQQQQQQMLDKLETICELTDGRKVEEAMELARQVEVAATKCVSKSTQLIETLDDGMESLPPIIVTAMNQAFGVDDDDEDDDNDDNFEELELTRTLDQDLKDIQICIDNIMDFNLANCLQVGFAAFASLAKRSEQSRSLFDSVNMFASDVDGIMDSFESSLDGSTAPNWNLLRSKASELWKCLQMTSQMKLVARAAGKLLEMIVKLFHAIADRISVLWKALADAKDCLLGCVDDITQAKDKCLEAKDRSTSLIDGSFIMNEKVKGAQTVSVASIEVLRELSDGDEICELIDLAQSMDGLAVDCSTKVTDMIDKVKVGFATIPPILTDGIVDLETDGKQDDDPTHPDIGPDIEELKASRQAMDTADVFTVAKVGMKSFSLLEGKAVLCRDTLDLVDSFASDCDGTISSFLNVWNLEVAQTKIKEMCRLVSLGDLMQGFVKQIKEFAVAMIDLLKSIIARFSSMDASMIMDGAIDSAIDQVEDIQEEVEDTIDDVKDQVEDTVDNLKDRFKNSKIGGLFRK